MNTFITVDNFEQLSKQELFDRAASHIITQGSPGWNEESRTCSYTMGCAASVFIKPEYREKADKCGIWYYLRSAELVPHYEVQFVRDLQMAHDNAVDSSREELEYTAPSNEDVTRSFFKYWVKYMHAVAEEFNLNPNILNGVTVA